MVSLPAPLGLDGLNWDKGNISNPPGNVTAIKVKQYSLISLCGEDWLEEYNRLLGMYQWCREHHKQVEYRWCRARQRYRPLRLSDIISIMDLKCHQPILLNHLGKRHNMEHRQAIMCSYHNMGHPHQRILDMRQLALFIHQRILDMYQRNPFTHRHSHRFI